MYFTSSTCAYKLKIYTIYDELDDFTIYSDAWMCVQRDVKLGQRLKTSGIYSVTRTGNTRLGHEPIEQRMQGFGRQQGGISASGTATRRLV